MRILVLGINYWPEETGIGPFNTLRCEYLAARGHEVTMCTTFPYYPQWRVAESYRGKLWAREVRNGVTVLRSWAWVPARVTSARRVLHEASFLAAGLLRALSARRPDVLLVESPPLGLGLTAALLSWWWRVPYVFDVMDLQPDSAAGLGMIRSGRLVRLMYAVERLAYRHAALVSTLTEGMRRRIIAKGVPAEKAVLFPPRAEPELATVRGGNEGAAFRRAHGLEGKFLAVHSGNMGVKQGLEVILRAAEQTRGQSDVLYLLVGDGAMRPALEARAAALGLTNVTFLPVQPRAEFLRMLAAADVALITQQRTVSDVAFPSKTVTYLAAGCPVIASVNSQSEVARVVRESGGGVMAAPEDARQLAEAVLALRHSPQLAAMSDAGRHYAFAQWDGTIILPLFESALLRVAGKTAAAPLPDSVLLEP